MQLNVSLYASLAAATATLLGIPLAQAEDWQVDSALKVYEEDKGVRSVSPSASLSRTFADDSRLSLNLHYDSLSGASGTGASGAAQTVTSPSGKPVSVPSGSGLVYAPFEDTRRALALTWDARLQEDWRYTAGAGWSEEEDFVALSVNAGLQRSFWRNNLTLAAAVAAEFDRIQPIGGTPLPFTLNGGSSGKQGEQQRRQQELLLSATAVLSPKTLAYVSAGISQSSGYLSDPYKVITVVDGITGQPVDGQIFDDALQPNEKKANLYEHRPDSRQRLSLYTELRQAFGQQVLTLDYRLTDDDWQVQSHTLGARWHQPLGQAFYLQPDLRWYRQSAAYFYRHSLVHHEDISGSVINVRYASADRRLAAFDALTTGVRLGWLPSSRQDLSLRLAHYVQNGDSHPADAIGAQREIDFFPRQRAWWAQLLYSVRW